MKLPRFLTRSSKKSVEGNYILMHWTNTYAQGVLALRQACENENNTMHPQFTVNNGTKIYRPLTIKENFEGAVSFHYEEGSLSLVEKKK